MQAPKLGILGGMGPQATQVFYQRVIDLTDAQTDQDHISTVILSDTSIPDRTAAIKSGETGHALQRLSAGIRTLEQCDCTVMAIPCNTAHYFLPQLQALTPVPILDMIGLTAQTVAWGGKRRVGILATDGTLDTGLYQTVLERLGLEPVRCDESAQRKVMSLIYGDIKAGRPGDLAKFRPAQESLQAQGCDCAILACTELSVFAQQAALGPYFMDALGILAQAAVTACGKTPREL